MLAGISADPLLGPLVACGAGGTAVEVLGGKIEFETGEEGRERAVLDHLLRTATAPGGGRGGSSGTVGVGVVGVGGLFGRSGRFARGRVYQVPTPWWYHP